VLCRKKWYRNRDQIEFHANKLLFQISSGRGKKVEKELKEIFANITTNNDADVEGPGENQALMPEMTRKETLMPHI